jgi:hypothetical protein
MIDLAFIVQGKTFLKSMLPLIIFSNSCGFKPIIFCIKYRPGKTYDNLDKKYLESTVKGLEKLINKVEIIWITSIQDAKKIMNNRKLHHVVCQDAQHHGKALCNDNSIKVYSIGVFFDTLHYANNLRLGLVKYESEYRPDIIYFADQRFKNEFERLYPGYNVRKETLGSPLYDHFLFNPSWNNQKKSVCFLATLQRLISQDLQEELERFIEYCVNNDIDFYVKTKYKTPWTFKNKDLKKHFKWYDAAEVGFPYVSLNFILNTDIHISSYSTSAVECEYFNKPCINLESVDRKDLTYAVNSIKHDYKFDDLFNSKTCKTVNCDILGAYKNLMTNNQNYNQKISLSDNNSTRILKSIKDSI